MHTELTSSPERAAAYIRRGKLAAFPTETVYGLGADALNPQAVRSIFEAKGRPSDNPLIVHLAAREEVPEVAASLPETANRLLRHFAPGPLTVILPRRTALPAVVSGGLDTVGVRIPGHPLTLSFLQACDTPVAAPSANRSGRPSPTTWRAVLEDLEGRIPCILKGDRTERGLESTVVDCTEEPARLLRAGAISLEDLTKVVPTITADEPHRSQAARSPGTKYRHYAPQAQVCLIDGPDEVPPGPTRAYIGLSPPPADKTIGQMQHCASIEEYARELFHFFRTCDAEGLTHIYCERIPAKGLGRAIMDRIERAAQR